MARSYLTDIIIGGERRAWAAINAGVADYSFPSIYRGPSRSPNKTLSSRVHASRRPLSSIEAMTIFTAKLPCSSYDARQEDLGRKHRKSPRWLNNSANGGVHCTSRCFFASFLSLQLCFKRSGARCCMHLRSREKSGLAYLSTIRTVLFCNWSITPLFG
jgi:hypothetical protein